MVLANYIQAFEDGVVEASNSPLLESYPNMLVDYSTVYGSGRIACVEYDDVLLTMNAEEQYEINIFLSNFSEQSFAGAGKFETETADAIKMAHFAMKHITLNYWDNSLNYEEAIEIADYEYRVDIEMINAITQRFFGRSVDIADIPTERDSVYHIYTVDGKVCYPRGAGDHHNYISVAEKMCGLDDGTIQVFFNIYQVTNDDYIIMDKSVYDSTLSEAEANQYFEYRYSGVAVVRPYTTESGEETYQLVSYEVVVK